LMETPPVTLTLINPLSSTKNKELKNTNNIRVHGK
jgi:hypothetical protein